MKFTSDVIKGYGDIDVPYTLISQGEEAEGIAIFLPGLGYTVQAPLLHYSTGIYLNKGYDVLHINYQYNSADYEGFSIEEVDDALKHDVKEVIDQVLQEKTIHVFTWWLSHLVPSHYVMNSQESLFRMQSSSG
ncbi:MAG: hypothetical protein ACQEWE_12895 [Bacillota bacterium]